ncbi:MAG: Ig-like domain-containing protein [Planctomycetes bacterium]|nr:Ig-like domain-containing protein [Planctomycetota bacterium]
MHPIALACVPLTLAFAAALPAQDAPQIVSLSPANGAVDVDPGIKTLTVVFDRAMGGGRSVVGGGPNFPTLKEVRWKNPKTFEIDVELQPDHDYAMGLNSQTFTNFRSTKGVMLEPVRWSFTTLPAELPDQKNQKQRNKNAWKAVQKVLAANYSYYDRVVDDWKKVTKAAEKDVLAAPTDAAWARAVAGMLAPCEDLHMSLRLGERFFGTASRAIDPLFRRDQIGNYVDVEPAGNDNALVGRTEDGIGYLMIASWTASVDLDAVEQALARLTDCKAMVIDARPNAGGGEDLALRIAAWFVDGRKVYAKNRYRVRAGDNGFGPVLDREIVGNKDTEKQIRGPIALLTSRYCMSSNEAFVLMIRQAPDCVQIGQPTYGSSGNPKPHDLPNGATIVLPSWQAMRPDGTCFEGEGIAPDVTVEADAATLKSRDPILEKALELLRDKIGK